MNRSYRYSPDPTATLTDAELERGIRSGDRRAAEELLRRHGAIAWRLAQAMVSDPDVAGAVLAEACRTLIGPGISGRPARSGSRLRLLIATKDAGQAARLPEANRAATDTASAMWATFQVLPPLSRALLWLAEVESLRPAQLEVVLGWPVGRLRAERSAALDQLSAGYRAELIRLLPAACGEALGGGPGQQHRPDCPGCGRLRLSGRDPGPLLRGQVTVLADGMRAAAVSAMLGATPPRLRRSHRREIAQHRERKPAQSVSGRRAVALLVPSATLRSRRSVGMVAFLVVVGAGSAALALSTDHGGPVPAASSSIAPAQGAVAPLTGQVTPWWAPSSTTLPTPSAPSAPQLTSPLRADITGPSTTDGPTPPVTASKATPAPPTTPAAPTTTTTPPTTTTTTPPSSPPTTEAPSAPTTTPTTTPPPPGGGTGATTPTTQPPSGGSGSPLGAAVTGLGAPMASSKATTAPAATFRSETARG